MESFVLGVKHQQINGIKAEDRDVRLLKADPLILTNAYSFLNRALLFNPQLVQKVYKFENIATVIRIALIDLDIDYIQRQTNSLIFDLSIKLDTHQQLNPRPSFFFF